MPDEHHNVILLGAGASVEAGIPVLNGFLDRMWHFAKRVTPEGKSIDDSDRALFLRALQIKKELEAYSSRAAFELDNLEDILSLLSFESLGDDSRAEKYRLMVKAVSRTIELSCKIPNPQQATAEFFAHSYYRELWHILFDPKVRPANPAIITFNYDLVLERMLWAYFRDNKQSRTQPVKSCAVKYDFLNYGFRLERSAGSQRPLYEYSDKAEVVIPYLKLHGSLNWDKRFLEKETPDGQRLLPSRLPVEVSEEPLILPPVFNKMDSPAINCVWKSALDILRQAKHIIIVGYSLPTTDIYMQHFIKAAVGPNSDLRRVFVFDPILFGDKSNADEMKKRYSQCFASNLLKLITFDPPQAAGDRGTFTHFVECLKSSPGNLFYLP